MERIKPTGVYGYLGRHLLRMASKSGTYIYYTENKDLVSTRSLKTCFYVTLSIFASNSFTCLLVDLSTYYVTLSFFASNLFTRPLVDLSTFYVF